jgi:hypothetical protein
LVQTEVIPGRHTGAMCMWHANDMAEVMYAV